MTLRGVDIQISDELVVDNKAFLILDLLIILGVIISKTATGEQRPAKNSNNYVFSL